MMKSTISTLVSGPPKRNPPWNRIRGRLSSPSHRWPRIQVCARPTRHTGTFLRAPSSPAKTENAEGEAQRAAAARPLRRTQAVRNVNQCRDAHEQRCGGEPFLVRAVNEHG